MNLCFGECACCGAETIVEAIEYATTDEVTSDGIVISYDSPLDREIEILYLCNICRGTA